MVTALRVTCTDSIPEPPSPPNDTIKDTSDYINKKLTVEQKEQLITSAEQFANILEWGAYYSQYAEAAKNVEHFREGGGADRNLTPEQVTALENELPSYRTNKNEYLNQFLDDIARQYRSGDMSEGCFILSESPGSYWLGATSRGSVKWFYAMGSFVFSFGARAQVIAPPTAITSGTLHIRYKIYIYDAYNWDLPKRAPFPKIAIDALDYATPGSIEPLKNMPAPDGVQDGGNYINEEDGRYRVSDAVMGSLVAAGKANFYDIKGQSTEYFINYGLPATKK